MIKEENKTNIIKSEIELNRRNSNLILIGTTVSLVGLTLGFIYANKTGGGYIKCDNVEGFGLLGNLIVSLPIGIVISTKMNNRIANYFQNNKLANATTNVASSATKVASSDAKVSSSINIKK